MRSGRAFLVHVTHAKAGSTWIVNLLHALFGPAVGERNTYPAKPSLFSWLANGSRHRAIYPAMFMTREQLLACERLRAAPRFVVIRDLRDTLVSLYFSLKVSHPTHENPDVLQRRKILNEMDKEDGLLFLLERAQQARAKGRGIAAIQMSWVQENEVVVRYETLLLHPYDTLRRVFLDELKLPVAEAALRRAIDKTRFEKVFDRELGNEDISSHGRRGLPGDWKNHFTPHLRRRFAEVFGDVLVATGYEPDAAWSRELENPPGHESVAGALRS